MTFSEKMCFIFLVSFCGVSIGFGQGPVSDFSSNFVEGCMPLGVKFTDKSTGNPTVWKWDLGNGTTSTFQNPGITYTTPGTYTITLTTSNADGSNTITKNGLITVYARPDANFTSPDTITCSPANSTFKDLSVSNSGTLNKWEWSFGDGAVSTDQNPVHAYTFGGRFSVFSRVTNSFGCTNVASKQQYIKVSSPVKAGFNNSTPNLCKLPIKVGFFNSSTGEAPLKMTWNFGDGTQSSTLNPTHYFTSYGSFTVTLKVENSNGCTNTFTKVIDLPAKSALYAGPSTTCLNTAATYSLQTIPQAGSIFWNMGDGTFYNRDTISHAYTKTGNYNITIITDFGDCRDTLYKTVIVGDSLTVNYSASDAANCKPPFPVTFNNLSVGGEQYKWFFGDGDSSVENNPTHTYKTEGSFAVTLIATNSAGCKVSLVRNDFVTIRKPVIRFTNLPGKGCKPFTFEPKVSIDTTDLITSYQWDFGDGGTSTEAKPSHVYADSGTYALQLSFTTQDGCSGNSIMPNAVFVGVPQPADFTVSQAEVCGKGRVQFEAKVDPSIAFFTWDFGDKTSSGKKNPLHQYQDTGTYSVVLAIEKNGCASSVTKTAAVKVLPPVASFTFAKDCNNRRKAIFTNTSIGAQTLQWNFGDNTTSNAPNPEHVYSGSGEYKVTLITTNVSCSDTLIQTVGISLLNPTIYFAKDSLCKNETTSLTITHPNSNSVVQYFWNPDKLGDTASISTTTATLQFAYANTGLYTFTGYTVDSFGCRDSVVKPNAVKVFGPIANFGVNNVRGCLNNAAVFLDSTKAEAGNPVVGWTWDYGDGTVESYTNPPFTHTYTAGGSYSVKLSIADLLGCTDNITKFDYVARTEGVADFITPDTLGCINSPIFFNNVSTGVINASYWDFGDGTTSTELNPVHNYADSGFYTVKLKIDGFNSCNDSIVKVAFINIRNPKAFFSLSDTFILCPPVQVNFLNSSYNAVNYEWDFGDGNLSTIRNPANVYLTTGKFNASLKVAGAGGCVDIMQKTIYVVGPYGNLIYDTITGCTPLQVTFKATTFGANKFTWDYGNGITFNSTDSSNVYTYQKSGSFIPTVLIQDPSGCAITLFGKDTIRVDNFTADFKADKVAFCDSGTVQFTDSIVDVLSNISYIWNFGDGQQSTQKNPSHFYNKPGKYTVTLTASSTVGCTKVITYPAFIKVAATPALFINAAIDRCIINNVVFTSNIKDSTAIKNWQWTFGNGQSSKSVSPEIQTFSSPGTYENSLTVVTQEGCSNAASKNVVIKAKPEIIAIVDTILCKNDRFTINAVGLSIYNWQPLTGLSCSTCSSPIATPAIDTWYTVTGMQSQTGCVVSDSILIKVVQPYTLATSGSLVLCGNKQVQLRATGAPAYTWIPAAGLSNSNIANPIADITGTIQYQVIGYDSLNCFNDTASINIRVSGNPTIELGPDVVISVGNTYTFKPAVSPDVVSYLWMPATGLSCTICPNPVLNVNGNITYSLKVSNTDGCSSLDNVKIIVTCNQSTVFIPNTFSPNGDGVNDYFFPRGKGINTINYFVIFNRWGQKVFEKKNVALNNQDNGWDGKLNGQKAESGVYTYLIEVVCDNSQSLKYTGNINLIQ